MTGSENRGEKQPGRVPLQTGPGRDAIAKSVRIYVSLAGLIQGNIWRQHTGLRTRRQCIAINLRLRRNRYHLERSGPHWQRTLTAREISQKAQTNKIELPGARARQARLA
jgi:hypothetical protein